jgi:hypothetical protein
MRRVATPLLALALGGVVLAGSGWGRTAQVARLRLVVVSPPTVAGTGFHARERTRLTAGTGNGTQTVRVTATRLGSFRVTFRQLTVDRCDTLRVVAVGSGSSRVVLKRLPAPACMPERSSG